MYLYLFTKSGKYYIIHPNGNIQRTDSLASPSGQWKMLGLQHRYRNRETFVPLENLQKAPIALALGKYYIVDEDHGTRRVWGEQLYGMWRYETLEQTPHYANGARYNLERVLMS